jgi:hypothetical protein
MDANDLFLMRLPGGLADIKTALALKHMTPYLMEIITTSEPLSDPTGADRDRAPIQSCKYHNPLKMDYLEVPIEQPHNTLEIYKTV